VVDWFSVVSGFNLRFSGDGPWQQLQSHDLFVTGQIVDQVDQANRRRVASLPDVAQIEPFHGLTHEAKDVFDPRPNLGLPAIALNVTLVLLLTELQHININIHFYGSI